MMEDEGDLRIEAGDGFFGFCSDETRLTSQNHTLSTDS